MSTTEEKPESTETVSPIRNSPLGILRQTGARPDADIVIYDGNCKFCQAQVRRLAWFGGDRLAFISLHDKRIAEQFPELSREQLMEQMYVISPSGEHYAGAGAVRYLSRRLPKLWFLAPLMHIPFSLPLWQYLYRQIAKSRYKIAGSCDDDSCKIQ